MTPPQHTTPAPLGPTLGEIKVCAGFLLQQNGLPLRPTAAGEKDVARDGWQQVELFGSLSVPLWAAPAA